MVCGYLVSALSSWRPSRLGCVMASRVGSSGAGEGIGISLKSVTGFWPRSIPTMGHRPPSVSFKS